MSYSNLSGPSSTSGVMTEKINLIFGKTEIIRASNSLKAMSHPLRLEILYFLAGLLEASVQEIVDHTGASRYNISRHLSILRDRRILVRRKDANKIHYRVADPGILHLVDVLRHVFCNVQEKRYPLL